jgi:20S proteasome alpha/beta subunit
MTCKNVAELFQEYTQMGGVRPFGIGMIVAGYDE